MKESGTFVNKEEMITQFPANCFIEDEPLMNYTYIPRLSPAADILAFQRMLKSNNWLIIVEIGCTWLVLGNAGNLIVRGGGLWCRDHVGEMRWGAVRNNYHRWLGD